MGLLFGPGEPNGRASRAPLSGPPVRAARERVRERSYPTPAVRRGPSAGGAFRAGITQPVMAGRLCSRRTASAWMLARLRPPPGRAPVLAGSQPYGPGTATNEHLLHEGDELLLHLLGGEL